MKICGLFRFYSSVLDISPLSLPHVQYRRNYAPPLKNFPKRAYAELFYLLLKRRLRILKLFPFFFFLLFHAPPVKNCHGLWPHLQLAVHGSRQQCRSASVKSSGTVGGGNLFAYPLFGMSFRSLTPRGSCSLLSRSPKHFFFSSRRRHTRSSLVSWARRCV